MAIKNTLEKQKHLTRTGGNVIDKISEQREAELERCYGWRRWDVLMAQKYSRKTKAVNTNWWECGWKETARSGHEADA
jgi:hypothetical protein